MTIQELAKEVSKYIVTYGWQKHGYGVPFKAQCLSGAIRTVSQGRAVGFELRQYLCMKANTSALVEWNDAPERTFQHVLDLLKQVEDSTYGS